MGNSLAQAEGMRVENSDLPRVTSLGNHLVRARKALADDDIDTAYRHLFLAKGDCERLFASLVNATDRLAPAAACVRRSPKPTPGIKPE